ncbi:uncharacterized protein At2g29880-like [Camellia sinensis]|uniref:uncharacterized protein At2g29880-like n=1 Tax=Camellia sinensis TaxID=4442 RepID=UPI0010366837|nr:uncharacterized protein At2g29880-like [Camellia sinensis]
MEAYESQQPTGDGKKRGKNIVWSKEMDKCLILELVHQANKGYKVDKGFKDQAYITACSSLNSSFNLSLNHEHCVNRLKTIKKKYRLVQEMLSKSGFSWNPMTKMVKCNDQVWTTYVAASKSRCKRTTGEWACSTKDVHANFSKKTNDSEDEYSHLFDPIDNMVENDVGDIEGNKFATQQGNTSSQKPTLGKRNHRSSKLVTEQSKKPKGAELVAETIVAIATNMARLANAYEKSKPCIDYLELYKAVMDVEELDINSRMTRFEYLNGDPIKARAFLIYP